MNHYIFLTSEGYTFQPDSEAIAPDIENVQVIGFGKGNNPNEAYKNLLEEYSYLLETNFDEIFCYKLAENFKETKKHFYLSDVKKSCVV